MNDENAMREWARRQAAEAPSWSDKKWREVCAILGIEMQEGREVKETHEDPQPPS